MSPDALQDLVKQCLEAFYTRRINNLSGLRLKDVLKRKNPYLLRAIGIRTASELVEYLLQMHTQASDETIFGETFVEPIALAVSGGHKSSAKGIDLEVDAGTVYKAVAVKSGPNVFNSSQTARMNDEFQELHHRLRQHLSQLGKQFDPVLGCAYGKRVSPPTTKRRYRIVSGKAFWEELTGDPEWRCSKAASGDSRSSSGTPTASACPSPSIAIVPCLPAFARVALRCERGYTLVAGAP